MAGTLPDGWPSDPDLGMRPFALSTGEVSPSAPAPGVQHRSEQAGRDSARLAVELTPERNHAFIFVTWRFFTTEFPRFSGKDDPDILEMSVVDRNGRRSLLKVESDDPRVFPVSESRADGTGYDLYAREKDALSVNSEFGLPAAGMTGQRTTGFIVEGDGNIKLEVRLADGGDNQMDSMAVIDRIELTSFVPPALIRGFGQCVNYNAYCSTLFPQPGSYLNTNFPESPPRYCEFQSSRGSEPQLDLRSPQEFRGNSTPTMIADGVTRAPLAFGTSDPWDEVEISFLEGNAPEDGGLGEFGSSDRLQSITTPTFEDQGVYFGEAQFYVPPTYAKSSLDPEEEYGPTRQIRFEICFRTSDGSDELCFMRDVLLARPPVLLVHGLWSDSSAWERFLLAGLPSVPADRSEYRSSNVRSFAHNRYIPQQKMLDICSSNHASNTYGAQVDYVGHSMGGNIARQYLFDGAPYTTINRLYTLNTPHLGSPLANLVVSIRDSHPSPVVRFLFPRAMSGIGLPVNEGAVDDLAVDSSALNELPITRVLSHALVGIGGTPYDGSALSDAPGHVGDIYRVMDFLTGPGDLFENIQHDLVVGRESQQGGLPPATYSIFNGLGSLHTAVTSSNECSNRILCPYPPPSDPSCVGGSGLANNVGTGNFSFFSQPSSVSSDRPEAPSPQWSGGARGLTTDGIETSSPTEGAVVESGDSVSISVESIPPYQADSVLFLSAVEVFEITDLPFDYSVDVPVEFVGDFKLLALGKDGAGVFSEADPAAIAVEPPAELLSLSISSSDIFLNGINDYRELSVTGQFSDGVSRDLSRPGAGTTYLSSNPEVATVSDSGIVRPVKNGVVTIIGQNDGVQNSIIRYRSQCTG